MSTGDLTGPSLSSRSGAVRTIPAIVYTDGTRNSGKLRSDQVRFSDALNTPQEFVVLHDVAVQSLHAARGQEINASSILIRKENIVIALPQESQAGRERSTANEALRQERAPVHAIVIASPFTIYGILHLPQEGGMVQHVLDADIPYMAITEATVHYHPSPLLGFKTNFLLVNRLRVELVIDESKVGQPFEDSEGIEPAVAETDLSGIRAAELLAGTGVFKGVNLAVLQEVCTELRNTGRITRKLVREGGEVFHQGDIGDTLYVVETGELAVVLGDALTEATRHVATLRPGDFFGEMAVLGEGRRTATVRATADSSLVALHEEAVKKLLQRFPPATTALLGIMFERRIGLQAARSAPK